MATEGDREAIRETIDREMRRAFGCEVEDDDLISVAVTEVSGDFVKVTISAPAYILADLV